MEGLRGALLTTSALARCSRRLSASVLSRFACSRHGSKPSDSAKAVRPLWASLLLLHFGLSPLLTTAQRFGIVTLRLFAARF